MVINFKALQSIFVGINLSIVAPCPFTLFINALCNSGEVL